MEIGDKFKIRNKKTNEVFEDTVLGITSVLMYVDYSHGADDMYYYNIVSKDFILHQDNTGKIYSIGFRQDSEVNIYDDVFELAEELKDESNK